MGSPEDERQDDLIATAESIHDDAERIGRLEDQKRVLPVGDPRVDAISHEVERIADDVVRKAHMERKIAAEAGPDANGDEGRTGAKADDGSERGRRRN